MIISDESNVAAMLPTACSYYHGEYAIAPSEHSVVKNKGDGQDIHISIQHPHIRRQMGIKSSIPSQENR